MPFNKIRYGRDRIMDKLVSQNKQRELDLLELIENAESIGVKRDKFKRAINMINQGFIEFEKAIMEISIK